MPEFTHLHVHTQFSILDGASKINALLDKAAVEPDETMRDSYYQQAEQILISDAGCLPLWYNTNYILVKPYVKNYKINAMGVPTLSQVHIEK